MKRAFPQSCVALVLSLGACQGIKQDADDGLAPAFRPGLRLVPPGPMTAQQDKRRAA